MPTNFRPDLKLVQGPDYPEHVTVDPDGFVFTTIETEEADIPARFTGIARAGDEATVPWETLVFGLETGRFEMRTRFLDQLRIDAAAGKNLERYGHALLAAFHDIFGGRGGTEDAPGFLAWLRGAIDEETVPGVRALLEGGLRTIAVRERDARLDAAGARAIGFPLETGHVPADHASVLYWIAELVPDWTTVLFDQTSTTPDDVDDDRTPHELHAWWAGHHIRAPAENRWDFVDPWSCAAFINSILRDIAKRDIRVFLEVEDGARAIVAPRGVLVHLREAGAIGVSDEDYDS